MSDKKEGDSEIEKTANITPESEAEPPKSNPEPTEREADVNVGTVDNSTTNIEGDAFIISGKDSLKDNIFDTTDLRFSKKMCFQKDNISLERLAGVKLFLAPSEFYDDCLDWLKRHHVLILNGSAKAATFDIAFLLGRQLVKEKEITTVQHCHPQGKTRINFELDIGNNPQAFGSSLLIFRNPLKRANSDFSEFAEALKKNAEETEYKEFVDLLKQNNTYLVLQVESNDLNTARHTDDSKYQYKVPILEDDAKLGFLKHLTEEQSVEAKMKPEVARFIREILVSDPMYCSEVVRHLRFSTEVRLFFQEIVSELEKSDDAFMSVDRVRSMLKSSKNLSYWLISNIGQDFSNWSTVLALALLHNTPDTAEVGVPIIQFEVFRRRLKDFLRKKALVKDRVKSWPRPAKESLLLGHCKIEKQVNTTDGRTYISFNEAVVATQIWSVLTDELSLETVSIIPFLIDSITSSQNGSNAARTIGRLGLLDYQSIVNQIERWSISSDVEQRKYVGYLYEGIYASENPEYIRKLDSVLVSLSESPYYEHVWTAVYTHRLIGYYDLDQTLKRFREIIENKIYPPFKEFKDLISNQNWTYKKFQILPSFEDLQKIVEGDQLVNTKREALASINSIAEVMRYCITDLCQLDPVAVFARLLPWFDDNEENEGAKIILARILLVRNGIFNRLDQKITIYDRINEADLEVHYMITVISIDEEARNTILEFLVKSVSAFELNMARKLEDALVTHLANWIVTSIEAPIMKNYIVPFYGRLFYESPRIYEAFENQLMDWREDENLKFSTLVSLIETHLLDLKKSARQKKQVDISKWQL